jgi:hypothetical protein
LKLTVVVPCDEPKPVPRMFTEVPTEPIAGDSLVIPGITETLTEFVEYPATVTNTGAEPTATPAGIWATMLLLLQLETTAFTPATVTRLDPCVVPKAVPVSAIALPVDPDGGETLESVGTTEKFQPLLGAPATVTTTGPVLAPAGTVVVMLLGPQFVGVASTPLKVIVLVPWGFPKLDPPIVTEVPSEPEPGDKLVIAGEVTVKEQVPTWHRFPWPFTANVMGPEVAPGGTAASMVVSLQLVAVVALPLNAKVLFP